MKDAQVVAPKEEVPGGEQARSRMEYSLTGINCLWIWEFAYIENGMEYNQERVVNTKIMINL
ncbi:MAG: hypothetical protein WCS03_12145 [Bacteroidota bacterium]